MVIPDWLAPKPVQNEEAEVHSAQEKFDHPLARPVDRLAAVIVDVFVLLVPAFILLSSPFKRGVTASFILGSEPDFLSLILAMVALAVALVVGYQAVMHYFWGATVGKMLFDLRVKPMFKGERLTFSGSLLRGLVWFVEVLCLGIPLLAVFSNSKRRALHDRICDSVVVSRSKAFVLPPGRWERGVVRGFFGACVLFVLVVGSFELRTFLDKLKGDRTLTSMIEKESGECEAVTHNLDHEEGEHDRLQMAMSLYAAGLAERTCLESELEREMSAQVPVGPITYLAQAFVNSDDAEVSNSYLDQVCEDAPEAVECAMSKVVSKWSAEDWPGVEELLTTATKGSGYLEVWGVRHFMKQARYPQALTFLDRMTDHKELAEFTLVQRVKALYNSYKEAEAGVALAQALPTLPKEDGEDLSAWMCAQQLQNGCAALENMACRGIQKGQDLSEIDFERAGPALSRVMALECQGQSSVDYLTFSEAVKDEDWQTFFRANLKQQKDDQQAAFRLYGEVIRSDSAPELLRVEALRRVSLFADRPQLASLVEMWQNFDSREAWVKGGNLLFTRFNQKKDQEWSLRVARHLMNSESLSPQSLAQLTGMVQGKGGDSRQPASVKVKEDVKTLLDSLPETDGTEEEK